MNNLIHDTQNLLDRAAHALVLFEPDDGPTGPLDHGPALDARAGGPVLSDRRRWLASGRRLRVETALPSAERGWRARNRLGERLARAALRWSPIPEGFAPFPGRPAPDLELDPSRSQRLAIEGRIELGTSGAEGGLHGFRTLGSGRTWPRRGQGQGRPAVDLAVVGSVLDPHGDLEGRQGVFTLSGWFASPDEYRLLLCLRVLDLDGSLLGQREMAAALEDLSAEPSSAGRAAPATTFLAVRTFADPIRTRMITAPAGGQGFEAPEIPTLVEVDFGLDESGRLVACQSLGQPVGEHNLKIYYFPTPQNPGTPLSPIPFFDEEQFLVDTPSGERIGGFRGDVVEGRSVQCPIPGAHPDLAPQLFGGIGRITDGTGCFAGATGTITNVGIGTVSPHLTSILYLLELDDPEGRFRV